MKALQLLGILAARFPRLLVVNALLLMVTSIAEAVAVLSLAPLVDALVATSPAEMSHVTRRILAALTWLGLPATLGSLLVFFVGASVVRSLVFLASQRTLLGTRYVVLRELMGRVFDDVLHARWFFYTDTRQGTLVNTFVREIAVVADAFGSMGQILAALFQIAMYLAVPLYVSWELTLVCFAAAMLFAVPFSLAGRIAVRLAQRTTAAGNEMGAAITECLGAAKIIIGFGNHQRAQERLDGSLRRFSGALMNTQTFAYGTPHVYYPFGMSVFAIGIMMSRYWGVALADTSVVLYSLFRIVPQISTMVYQKNLLDSSYPSYRQVVDIGDKARALRQPSGTRAFTGLATGISLRDVSFAYPGGEVALNGVDAEIPKGSMVAFVGESGSGKSTLIDLLMRFHEPTSGSIDVDDVPLATLSVDAYRARIGYVPQDSVLFNTTIRENLMWAAPAATEDAMREACRRANALEFVDRLPAGLDTEVGDRGVRLSGGQVQRLALVRALLRRPDILILDEATSSLDSHSERMIQSALDDLAGDATVVVVAHRLSTIANADRIYVLRQGRVVESGTYGQLLARDGVFARMVHLQTLAAADNADAVA